MLESAALALLHDSLLGGHIRILDFDQNILICWLPVGLAEIHFWVKEDVLLGWCDGTTWRFPLADPDFLAEVKKVLLMVDRG